MIATSKAIVGYGMALAAIYTGQAVIDLVVPASRWFEVQSIKVRDTTTGTAPTMVVSRTIHRPFYGEWTAEVERMNTNGSFTMICQAEGRANYNPGNALPSNLDLDWWTYPVHCNLGAGKYRLDTIWRVFPKGITPREVHYVSNVFEVKEPIK